MPDYGSSSYWDERYSSHEDSYDWYQDYFSLEEYIAPHLKRSPDFEILIPGCGNSSLGASIYDQGYVNITNIDSSQVVISRCQDLYVDKMEMEYTMMDARNVDAIPGECFDLIIDKALFDALLCSVQNLSDIQALLREMFRVLKTNGAYIIISHGCPDKRLHFIKQTIDVDIEVISIPKKGVKDIIDEDEFHYIYICKKSVT